MKLTSSLRTYSISEIKMDIVQDKIKECFDRIFSEETVCENDEYSLDFSTSEFVPLVYNGKLAFEVHDAVITVDDETYMGNDAVGIFNSNLNPEELAKVVTTKADDVVIVTKTELHEFNKDGSYTLDVEYTDFNGEDRNLVLTLNGGEFSLSESVEKVVNAVKWLQEQDEATS